MRLLSGSEIVDLQGRPVRDKYVSGSALIKAQQWIDFLDDWSDRLRFEQPWALFMLHATLNFHQAFAIMARRLRKNRAWTGGGTMAEDTVGLVADAEQRLAWFETNSEQLDMSAIPQWARFLFAAIEGGLRMLVRIAKEVEQVLRKGHLLIPVDRQGVVVRDTNEDNPDAVGAEREL